jgi:hypothetical protein
MLVRFVKKRSSFHSVRQKNRGVLPQSRFIVTQCCSLVVAKNIYNMGKITENNQNDKTGQLELVGQPIFKQIMNLVDKVDIQVLIRKHESDYCY